MKITRRSIVRFFTGLTLVAIAACGNETTIDTAGENTAVPNAGEVNLYSSRHYDTDEILYDQFTEETGIEVNVIEGSADELIERIKSEGANSPADVFIAVDVGRLWRAEEAGILQPISSETLENAIPANLRSPEGYWYAFSKRARVIVYNQNNVNPENLSTYEALAEPEWEGRVCVRSSENIYNQSLVAAKIEEKGEAAAEEWVKGLVSNFAREPEGNDTAQIQAVASGECDVALVNHYYVARLMESEDATDEEIAANVGVFYPNQDAGGTHINVSGAGIVANAPNVDNAVQFLEFLVTPEAQEIFANANNEFPVVDSVDPNPTVVQLGEFQASDLDVAAYGKKNPDAVKLMDRAGWK